ncbi:hypothetical protein POPTR_002G259500v4 [Populus trichocarpa]|uniref:Knottin scorpion toxin-like domain-containing protein n=1 Tax=Populus trichocarpa TaxID=3694 RepID=A0A2K2BPT8_POPTR|nr:hypothetical protein POPTR_002G259500v4 [Populus trichocarpa]
MAKLYSSSSLFILALLLLISLDSGLSQVGKLSRCVSSWDCKDKQACKDECSSRYAGGYGLCTGHPRACICSYDCPPLYMNNAV